MSENPENTESEVRGDTCAQVPGGSAAAPADGMSIEDAFARIRDLLSQMEQEDVPLETAFENYEQGMRLIRYCNEKIDSVEQRVRQLNADGSVTDFE